MSSFIFKYNHTHEKQDSDEEKPVSWSFWQSTLWSTILTKTKQAEIITTHIGNTFVVIERRTIWRSYTGLFILGVSPALVTQNFIESLQSEVVARHDLFLQIEPMDYVQEQRAKSKEPRKAPFRRFLEPVTAILDLKWKTEDSLIASFAEKGRYNIRLAQKRGVTVRWVQSNEICNPAYGGTSVKRETWNEKVEIETCPLEKGGQGGLWKQETYIENFYKLLEETTNRDGFSHNSLEYYKSFVETLEENNAGGLLVAEKEGILHAAGVFAYWGDVGIYYYGASSSDATIRRDMATYLLQWEAIREAMRRGCTTYDFLGISHDGKGKLAWVTEFKLRFNPEKTPLPEERVFVFKPWLLWCLQFLSRSRKLFK